jgi:hypothetical protein
MKKLILALLAVGTIATANAQEPRSILLYGDVGFHSDRHTDNSSSFPGAGDKVTMWDVNAGVGYQFNHNWTLGAKVMWGQNADKAGGNGYVSDPFVRSYLASTGTNATEGESFTNNMYAVGPFARYSHYIRKSETFFWYSQLDFDYVGGYWTAGGNPAYLKNSGIFLGLYPALGINVGCGYCINFAVGGINYTTIKYTGNTPTTLTTGTNYSDNAFNFTFGQQVNVGLSKNFNCGHKMHSHHEPGDEIHRRKMDKMEDEDDAAPKPKRKERNRDEDE